MRIGAFSALYNAYDAPKPIPDLGIPCVMYTDDPDLKVEGWEVRYVNHGIATLNGSPSRTGPMLAHKWFKTHLYEIGHETLDVAIWMDASMVILRDDLAELCIEALDDDDLALTPHPVRDNIYDEASYSATLLRYQAEATYIKEQARYYREEVGHPRDWGNLMGTGFSVTRLNERTKLLGEQWWWECTMRSHQDQISLPVLLRLNQTRGLTWNFNCPWAEWWGIGDHLK